jgi:hypothetical protein
LVPLPVTAPIDRRVFAEWETFAQAVTSHFNQHFPREISSLPDGSVFCRECGVSFTMDLEAAAQRLFTVDNGEPAEHHRHTSLLDLFETARLHVESRLRHHVLVLDDPQNRQFGFVCDNCRTTFLIRVEDCRAWMSQASPEARRLIAFFLYRRAFFYGLMNSSGDMLRHIEPLAFDLDEGEPVKTSYQRIIESDDD